MVRIDYLVFGYRRLKINPEHLSKATSLLLRKSIPSRIDANGMVIVRERDFSETRALFSGRIDFSASESMGLYGKYKRLPYKPAYLLAVLVSSLFLLLLSSMVWDIRIEGNENIPDGQITLVLSECGLSVGDFWFGVDRSKTETTYLEKDRRISWININRRGSVAYVMVMENEAKGETEEEGYQYSNIVALTDCIIEEITVKRGIAVVKPGDVVKKGDILIVGMLPEESGGGFCSAQGSVVGRIKEKISVDVGRNYDKTSIKDKKLCSVTLNFFKISLNIFKLYGNLTNECDIIETEKTYSIFGSGKLPFSVSVKYMPEYERAEAKYTDEEIVRVAASRLDAMLAGRLVTSDILKIKTHGEFTDGGYTIGSDIVFLSEVSEQKEFKVE